LVDRLAGDGVSFHVHVSGITSEETYRDMREALAGRSDVEWVDRVDTYYFGWSMVEGTLNGLRSAVTRDPRHVVVISGQDYPLKQPDEIAAQLEAHEGTSFVHHYALPTEAWARENGGMRRIRYYWLEGVRVRRRPVRLPFVRRRFPAGFVPYGGSAWVALSGEAARYILRFVEENPAVVGFFRNTLIPDELFVQTVLLNSPLRDRIVNDEVHYVDWSANRTSPKTLTVEDFPALAASDKLLARKFDAKEDGAVLDLIDRELLGRAR
jgi:hypothetical protein